MKLNYKIFGSGPPLFILHGLFGMLDNWRTIARMLEDKYQCILIDLRNHGRSPHDDEMNYQVMARDVLELMNDLNIDHAMALGHSMGGKVVMQFALSYPDRIEKLIVVDIAPKKYPFRHNTEIEAIQSIEPAKLKNRTEAKATLTRYLGDDHATIQLLLKNLFSLPESGFEWKANMPVLIAEYDRLLEPIAAFTAFNKPVLFIRGEKSNSIKNEDWFEIISLFPKARIMTIANAGHWINADQPEALKEQILAFMNV